MEKANVAIVDDHRDIRAMLKMALDEWYSVDTYDTAREAFDGFKKNRPDVVVMDMILTDSHGLELRRWMRADPILRGVPVIALSGLPYDSEKLASEVARFVSKPVDVLELVEAIESCLNRSARAK